MLKKILRSEYFPIAILLAACFLAGAFTVRNYGESWDEYNFFSYASESLAAYQNLFQPNFQPAFTDPTLRYYGPWFLVTILLAGFGLEYIFTFFEQTAFKVVLLTLVLLPGMWGMIRLHPYEYIYYNQFAGGVAASFRRFEMDYWGTSFREVAGYLNANAPENSAVVVWGPTTAVWRFVRHDISVYDSREAAAPRSGFYAVILTRNDNDLRFYTDLPAEFVVKKDGALLSVVKFVP